MATGKILVIRGGAIGDFILTLPVLAAIRGQFPEIHLEILGYPRVTPLAVAGNLVHRAESIEARALASFFAKNGRLPSALAKYFEGFALIISYLYDPDRIFQENVGRCSKAQFIVGPHRPDESAGVHATEAFLHPLERLAIFNPDATPRLRIESGQELPVNSTPRATTAHPARSLLALHPGSGSERKNWPQDKWKALLRRLVAESSVNFLLVGGEAETERLIQLSRLIPSDRRDVALNLPLVEVAIALQTCHGYIGHDSGISHLAAALGLTGLLLWGDTKQRIWRPRSDRIQLIESSAGLSRLGVEEVFTAIKERFL